MNNIAIIGAGPSGVMAAIYAAENPDNKITIFDKSSPLKTILYTGGGRCNLSYAEFDNRELAKFYPRGEKFLLSVFSQFSVDETIDFFKNIGIETYVQPDKRIFPKSNKASDVRDALLEKLKNMNIRIETTQISDVEYSNNKFILKNEGGTSKVFDSVILSTGGRGGGHMIAKKLSHTLTPLKPALCSLVTEKTYSELSGLTLKNISADVFFDKKKQFNQRGDFLFTHFGISGPVVYKISSYAAFLNYSKTNPLEVRINLVNNTEDVFDRLLASEFLNNGKKSLLNVVSEYIPKNLAKVILSLLEEDGEKKVSEVNKTSRKKIAAALCSFELDIIKPYPGGEIVTAGGVNLDELNPKTLESKIVPNLFFCGEILNIDGLTGGFNLQNCWSSGFVVGNSLKNRV